VTLYIGCTVDFGGHPTLHGKELARKGKWKENGRFWQCVKFARNEKCKEK